MANIHQSKALNALFRMSMLGISQGIATLLCVILFLLGCGPRAIMCVMLGFAIAGLAIGHRATVPRP